MEHEGTSATTALLPTIVYTTHANRLLTRQSDRNKTGQPFCHPVNDSSSDDTVQKLHYKVKPTKNTHTKTDGSTLNKDKVFYQTDEDKFKKALDVVIADNAKLLS